jgi:hypothetical protein
MKWEDIEERRRTELEWIFTSNITVEIPEREKKQAIDDISRYMTEQIDVAWEHGHHDRFEDWEDELDG